MTESSLNEMADPSLFEMTESSLNEMADPSLFEMADPSSNEMAESSLFEMADPSSNEMAESSLFDRLKHPNPHLRDRAMVEIAETRDETTIPRLMGILAEEDTIYRRAAVKVLGAIGTDTVPSLVDSLLNSDNSTIRSSCAKALAQVAINYKDIPFPSDGIEGLKQGLNDENPVVHIASAMALGVIGVPALDSLLEVLDGTDNLGLAVAILNAVSSINDDRSKEVLSKLANDESADTYVRQTANSALSRLDMLKFKSGSKE